MASDIVISGTHYRPDGRGGYVSSDTRDRHRYSRAEIDRMVTDNIWSQSQSGRPNPSTPPSAPNNAGGDNLHGWDEFWHDVKRVSKSILGNGSDNSGFGQTNVYGDPNGVFIDQSGRKVNLPRTILGDNAQGGGISMDNLAYYQQREYPSIVYNMGGHVAYDPYSEVFKAHRIGMSLDTYKNRRSFNQDQIDKFQGNLVARARNVAGAMTKERNAAMRSGNARRMANYRVGNCLSGVQRTLDGMGVITEQDLLERANNNSDIIVPGPNGHTIKLDGTGGAYKLTYFLRRQMAEHGNFVEIKDVSPEQLRNDPRLNGAIIVFNKSPEHPDGHATIKTGQNEACSDRLETIDYDLAREGHDYHVFMPMCRQGQRY